jgi:hypothetical protein
MAVTGTPSWRVSHKISTSLLLLGSIQIVTVCIRDRAVNDDEFGSALSGKIGERSEKSELCRWLFPKG